MNYQLKIRGVEDPLVLDKLKGDALIEQWFKYKQAKPSERPKFNLPVKLEGYVGTISDIYSFQEVKRTRAEKAETTYRDHDIYFAEETKKIRKLDLEARAKRLEEYKTAYWCLTGEYPSEEQCLECARRQYVFFKENPLRTVANLEVWQLPEPKQTSCISIMNVKGRSSLLLMLGNLIANDRRLAK